MFTLWMEPENVPTYSYTCTSCNDVIEKRQSFSDPPLTTCEQCGGQLRKIIHPVGIVFKGSGWYVTDSRSSSSAATGAPSSSPKTESSGSGDSKSNATESSGASSGNGSASTSSSSKESSASSSSSSSSSSKTGSAAPADKG